MSWNYRVIKRISDDGMVVFAVHEVYYDKAGKPELVTENPCYPQGGTLEKLMEDCEWYQKALEEPVLSYEDFVDLALQSEVSLARDWDRPEEDEAWSHLAQLPQI